MNFNTHEFIFIFLPLTLLCFYLAPPRLRLPVLLIASLVFYGWSGQIPLLLLLISIVWAYGLGQLQRERSRTSVMILAAAGPLVFLWLFKYLGFSYDVMGLTKPDDGLFGFILTVSVPAGISFYTFQAVAYNIDLHRGKAVREANLVELATFISLFSQLIAGPILRYSEIKPQLDRIKRDKLLKPDFVRGIKFLAIGLAGKIFGADILRLMHEKFTLGSGNSLDALYSIFSYSFIIYYDFWSYSLMAVGLGKLLSIELPKNFDEPYLAQNPKVFWRKWHITLSYWLRDYLYLPLGGNKSYTRNLLIVFLACGLWHGAGTNFIVWGAYHAILVIVYNFTRPVWDRLPSFVGVTVTFGAVSLGWPLFYLDVPGFMDLTQQLFAFDFSASSTYAAAHWGYLALIGSWTFLVREAWWLWNERPVAVLDSAVFQAGLLVAAVMFFSFGRTFIYFQF